MSSQPAILAVAAAHNIAAIANIDGVSVALLIETRTPVLYADGSVAFYEDGSELIEVSTISEARAALGN